MVAAMVVGGGVMVVIEVEGDGRDGDGS